jgi:hypothetical protein
MRKELLINMIELAKWNRTCDNKLSELALQINVDPELEDVVCMTDFSTEQYLVRDLKWIKQCMFFHFE